MTIFLSSDNISVQWLHSYNLYSGLSIFYTHTLLAVVGLSSTLIAVTVYFSLLWIHPYTHSSDLSSAVTTLIHSLQWPIGLFILHSLQWFVYLLHSYTHCSGCLSFTLIAVTISSAVNTLIHSLQCPHSLQCFNFSFLSIDTISISLWFSYISWIISWNSLTHTSLNSSFQSNHDKTKKVWQAQASSAEQIQRIGWWPHRKPTTNTRAWKTQTPIQPF